MINRVMSWSSFPVLAHSFLFSFSSHCLSCSVCVCVSHVVFEGWVLLWCPILWLCTPESKSWSQLLVITWFPVSYLRCSVEAWLLFENREWSQLLYLHGPLFACFFALWLCLSGGEMKLCEVLKLSIELVHSWAEASRCFICSTLPSSGQ